MADAAPKPDEDPILALCDLIDTIEGHIATTKTSLHRNERNRLNLLTVHAIAALLIAPQFAASAPTMVGTTWQWLRHIPWWPYSMACLMGAGGIILLPATFFRARRWEMVGLNMLAAWYLIIAVGFGGPQIPWTLRLLRSMLSGHPQPTPISLYAWNVYGHLSAIMLVHLATLHRIGRGRHRSGAR